MLVQKYPIIHGGYILRHAMMPEIADSTKSHIVSPHLTSLIGTVTLIKMMYNEINFTIG